MLHTFHFPVYYDLYIAQAPDNYADGKGEPEGLT